MNAEVVALERAVWDALVAGDAAVDEALLSADFVGLYPTGFAGRSDHVGQLANGPTVHSYQLSAVRTMEVAADAVLVLYRAEYVRIGGGPAESMYVSSLWRRRGDGWVNVFSQDTPATGEVVV